jgi:hypothetical protein
MQPHIFREYDIRAVVDKEITLDEVRLLGRALGTRLFREGRSRIALGRDGRLSSGPPCWKGCCPPAAGCWTSGSVPPRSFILPSAPWRPTAGS